MTQAESVPWLQAGGYVLGLFAIAVIYGWLVAPYSLMVLPLGVIFLSVVSLAKPKPIENCISKMASVAFGVLYCCTLFPFLGRLRSLDQGLQLSIIALFCTWASDTSAYFVGRVFGRHKLYPVISPKKTVEGAVGGIAGGIAAAYAVVWALGADLAGHHVVSLGALAAVFGIFGDLVASMVKRSTQTKDSSQLIPGHGGVLDRFDGVMFAAPAVYTYVILFLS